MRAIEIDFAVRAGLSQGLTADARARQQRLAFVTACVLLWACGLFVRLYSLQIKDFERWQEWAVKQHFAEVKLASERGPIYDRNEKLLALSIPAGSVYVRPRQVKQIDESAEKLAAVLKLPVAEVRAKLTEKKPFVWVARQLPREETDRVEALKLPGAGVVLESKRVYPYKFAAAPLIGKVGIDGLGLSGIESLYEQELQADHVSSTATRDALGNLIDISAPEASELPRGSAVRLTIDTGLQMIVDEELEAGRRAANAKGGVAIMIDSVTGEVLAMSQAPLINHNVKSAGKDALKNVAVETVFEPGSIMKPLVAAAAIESKVVRPDEMIDCMHGRLPFGRHTIKDVHPSDVISFRDVVVRSSNIGMTKVGLRLGSERLYGALRSMGFGERSSMGLKGETAGILRPVARWAAVDVATHSFGQGVAVTPLQVVRAMASIVNGGMLPTLRVVSDDRPYESTRIFSENTSRLVREMMYAVVEDQHGTGGKAAVQGVRIGGKTGTAQKARPNGGGYMSGVYVASFAGFADATGIGIDQRLSLVVLMDEPNTTSIYGGTLAAPVFQKIMQRSLHLLSTRRELATDAPSYGRDSLMQRAPSAPLGLTPVSYHG